MLRSLALTFPDRGAVELQVLARDLWRFPQVEPARQQALTRSAELLAARCERVS